ncbi:MAG: fibronectin type III domain-containing protein, partial [Patescibacteria group bacterium]
MTTPASDTTAPTVPGTPTASSITNTSATLSWGASTDAVGVAGYHVYIYKGVTLLYTYTTGPSITSYTDTNLTPSTTYSFKVVAYDIAGNSSSQSAPVDVTTLADTTAPTPPDTTTPSTPTSPSATAVSSSQINLSWTASTDNVGVTAYRVYRAGTLITTLGNVTTYSNTGLNPSTPYSYTVDAVDGAGNVSSQSSVSSATTQAAPVTSDTTTPTVPGTPTSSNITQTSATLTWSASTDAVGVTGYKVFRNGTQIATPTTPSYIDSGLTAQTAYSYTVSAYDGAGNNSGLSGSVGVTTLAPLDTTAPTVPGTPTASGITTTSATLSWGPSTDASGIGGYMI